jgi:hypothetical protein
MPITDLKSKNRLEIRKYFENKSLHDLDVSELAYIHLDRLHGKVELENCTIYSSLYDLMETAQSSFNNARTRIYTPLLSCFAIIDQIGGAYSSTLSSTNYGGNIKAALDLFSNFSKIEIEKLYSLRNGLYHDGSLMNISTHGGANVIFRLSQDATSTITAPNAEWDGIYHNSLDQYITRINTKKLKEDVEAIVNKCSSELLDGTLKMKIDVPREFFFKFLFSR